MEFDFSLESDNEINQFLVVIIYDISDNRRRYRLSKCLKSYGIRVQKSAFECLLINKFYNRLIKDIEKLIIKEDYVRVYKLSLQADVRVYGQIGKLEPKNDIFIL